MVRFLETSRGRTCGVTRSYFDLSDIRHMREFRARFPARRT
jgi:hypothetical protein